MLREALHPPIVPCVLCRASVVAGAVGGMLAGVDTGVLPFVCSLIMGCAAGWATWTGAGVVSFAQLLLATLLDRDSVPRTRTRVVAQTIIWYTGVVTFSAAPFAAFFLGSTSTEWILRRFGAT